jgi:hypothetical protein
LKLTDDPISTLIIVFELLLAPLDRFISIMLLLDFICFPYASHIQSFLTVESGCLYAQSFFIGEMEQTDEAERG